MKTCKKCHTAQSLANFHRNRNTPDGYSYYCKDCKRAYDRAYHEPKLKKRRMYASATHKQCRLCERVLEKRYFSQYRSTYCKECVYAYQARRQISRYGISYEQYIAMARAQGYKCAICHQPEKHNRRLSIDHDHSCCNFDGNQRACGKCVRGLICSHCNKTLGMVNDDPQRLEAMIRYLYQHA